MQLKPGQGNAIGGLRGTFAFLGKRCVFRVQSEGRPRPGLISASIHPAQMSFPCSARHHTDLLLSGAAAPTAVSVRIVHCRYHIPDPKNISLRAQRSSGWPLIAWPCGSLRIRNTFFLSGAHCCKFSLHTTIQELQLLRGALLRACRSHMYICDSNQLSSSSW